MITIPKKKEDLKSTLLIALKSKKHELTGDIGDARLDCAPSIVEIIYKS